MDLRLSHSGLIADKTVSISGSKSETNRLLLLQSLFLNIRLQNISDSDDSKAMMDAIATDANAIDIHHAGTAMRFLTAYFAVEPNREVLLTGSDRMQERPIKILVDALRELGAQIEYAQNEGFPPLKIKGKKLMGGAVSLPANVSSQYISALLLIAPKLENGLELTLEGEITSAPYIGMTLALLEQIGVKVLFENQRITVFPKSEVEDLILTIESDWSSASYFYSVVALSEVGTQIALSSFKPDSLQGDRALAEIYESFGVETVFEQDRIVLRKTNDPLSRIEYRLSDTPDLAQTVAVTSFGLGVSCTLTGLHTLKIKETDRLEALRSELAKLGADVSITDESLMLQASEINPNIKIATYNDHRMAMAFAPLALKVPIVIQNAEVVSKSFPNFWTDLKTIGFSIAKI